MTKVARMRLDPDDPFVACDVAVDWYGTADDASTVHVASGFFGSDANVPSQHRRLLEAAAAVYVADKCFARTDTTDGWTRDIELHVPNREGELPIEAELNDALGFLTGDRWSVTHEGRSASWELAHKEAADADAVCLFSGGLDSFAGAIELLEDGRQIVLVGHSETPFAAERQTHLARALADAYPDQVELRQLFLRPAPKHEQQRQPVKVVERTTRSRSFLFIAGGLSLAGATDTTMPLYVPENGFIGINVPLTPARTGSASTRTTHPRFLSLIEHLCCALEIRNAVVNPFRLATKGEVVQRVAHVGVFRRHARETVSCSHPEEGRWPRGHPMTTSGSRNCGYCYPCLIRRASLHTVGWDDVGDYRWDVFNSEHVLGPGATGADLRAVVRWLHRSHGLEDFARHGKVGGDTREFHEVYVRGHNELRVWLESAPRHSKIKDRLP